MVVESLLGNVTFIHDIVDRDFLDGLFISNDQMYQVVGKKI